MEYLMLFFGLMVIAALTVYLGKKALKDAKFDDDLENDLERMTSESLETTRIVADFRIFLMELRERIANGEVSTERARELVLAKKALAFDRIHRLVVLGAKKNDNSCGE